MTDQPPFNDLSTLDGRRGSATFELSDDASSFRFVRVFGAAPERVFRAFTEPDDLRVWFPAGAPPGSEMTVCESEPVAGGRYHYVMVIPDYGEMAWHGIYTGVDRPARIDADEWFVMGNIDPAGPPSRQMLTFEPTDSGFTLMRMQVDMPESVDPDTFMEQSAAGLDASLNAMDLIVSV